MKPQIEAAARWWCNKLFGPDSPDPIRRDAMTIAVFYAALTAAMEQHCRATWRPDDPQWGAALRTAGCDYHPDPIFNDACLLAGIRAACPPFPEKVVMFIDPDSVRVNEGGERQIVVWDAQENP